MGRVAADARLAPPSIVAPTARVATRSIPVRTATAFLLVLFLVAFPKGGVKLAGVPITWGYLMLGIPAAALAWHLASGAGLRLPRRRLLALGALIPFQLLIWGTLLVHGFEHPGFMVSLLVTFFFIPPVMLLGVGVHLDEMDLRPLFRWIRNAVLFVAVYGIVLFFYTLATGEFIEVPYLTMNAGDVGELGEKFNDRGGIWKLISTYNNGNLYGVSMLLLLPLYMQLERGPVKRSVVKMSLLLSLSRTVWVGLLLWEFFDRIYVRGLSVRRLVGMVIALAAAAGAILFALVVLLKQPLGFLVSRDLGGRKGLELLPDASVLPDGPYTIIPEIVYAGVVNDFGMLGLVLYVLAMLSPLLLAAVGAVPFAAGTWKRALMVSLVIYTLIAAIDGGLLFIPVAAFYWFVASLLLSDNPSLRGDAELSRQGPSLKSPRFRT